MKRSGPPRGTEETLQAPDRHAAVGLEIGPYRLRRKLGEGGMGEVWAAEQKRPVRRQVALKLIRWGMDSRQVLARFESERQALALMSHPSIAAIHDAGTTDRGRPYFAMEYVEGEPITDYCDRHRLRPRHRLELFRQVCEGVQHAHQKGIIHRDLKPSNVLVTVQQSRPLPKIIDFGVAKATAQRLTEKTVFTEFGQLIGTPEYMSPEQAEMTGLDIDTRADVYSLGALLYELLAGVPPFDPQRLRASGFVEIQRRIREEEPPLPSTRVARLGKATTATAERRRLDPAALVRRLRGDLDWVVMKALDKDRTRRYSSASELSEDVRRYLRHEPVTAGPPGTAYRARKFVRRHRAGVAAAALVVLALVAGTVGTALGLVRARRAERLAVAEAETARQVSDFMVELFEVSDPSEARGNEVTAREILDRGAERIESELAGQPEVQGRLLHTVGKVYRGLGLEGDAVRWLEKALAARRGSAGTDRIRTAETLEELASLLSLQGAYGEAETRLERALEIRRRLLGPEDPTVAATLERLAFHYTENRRFGEAEAIYADLVPVQERLLGPRHQELGRTLYGRARNSVYLERFEDAAAQARRAVDIQRQGLPADHPELVRSIYLLAETSRILGHLPEAVELFETALAAQVKILGPDHRDVGLTQYHLALAYAKQGRLEEAARLMLRVLEMAEGLVGRNHWRYAEVLHGLAQVRAAQGRLEEAIEGNARAVEIMEAAMRPEDSRLAEVRAELARNREALERRASADRRAHP